MTSQLGDEIFKLPYKKNWMHKEQDMITYLPKHLMPDQVGPHHFELHVLLASLNESSYKNATYTWLFQNHSLSAFTWYSASLRLNN